MEDHIYKKVEVVGTSTVSVEEAIRNAVRRAHDSLRNLRWFEVSEIRGDISGAEVLHFQVTMKLGFKIEDGAES